MTDIRINQLPAEASPVATDVVPIDGATVGGATRKTTIEDLVLVGRPTASQAEAEAGTNPTKVMTPLTVNQAVTFYGLTKAGNLAGLADPPTSRTNLGLGGAAVLAVGTTAGTVAAGDDARIVGAAQKAQNLNDLASKPTARLNLTVPVYVADRTALKAIDTTKDAIAYLLEGDRQGAFKWTAGDFSAQVAADALELPPFVQK